MKITFFTPRKTGSFKNRSLKRVFYGIAVKTPFFLTDEGLRRPCLERFDLLIVFDEGQRAGDLLRLIPDIDSVVCWLEPDAGIRFDLTVYISIKTALYYIFT